MPQLVHEQFFDGAEARMRRLGLLPIVEEVRSALTEFRLEVEERRGAKGGGALRQLLAERFREENGWVKKTVGGIDQTKCSEAGGIQLCVGVEIQVSARSDLIAVDLLHLKQALRGGWIDLGILVVPSDRLATFLPSRFPSISEALRILENFDADSLPLILWGIEHDGPGTALPVRGRG